MGEGRHRCGGTCAGQGLSVTGPVRGGGPGAGELLVRGAQKWAVYGAGTAALRWIWAGGGSRCGLLVTPHRLLPS